MRAPVPLMLRDPEHTIRGSSHQHRSFYSVFDVHVGRCWRTRIAQSGRCCRSTVSLYQMIEGPDNSLQDEEQKDNGCNLYLSNSVGHRITLLAELIEEECAVDVACLVDDSRCPVPEETASNGQYYRWDAEGKDDEFNSHEESWVKAFAHKEE